MTSAPVDTGTCEYNRRGGLPPSPVSGRRPREPESIHFCVNSYTVVNAECVALADCCLPDTVLRRLPQSGSEDPSRDPAAGGQPEDRNLRRHRARRQQLARVGGIEPAERSVEQNEIGYMTGSFDDRLERRPRPRHPQAGGEQLLGALGKCPRVGIGDKDVGGGRRDGTASRCCNSGPRRRAFDGG